jgi:hypothetical protein
VARNVQVKTIACSQSERGANFRRDNEAALRSEHECGIHEPSVPRALLQCHGMP